MAEESNAPLVTPVKKEFGAKKKGKNSAGNPGSLNTGSITCRSSTGSYHNGDNARRYSSEKLESANISQHMIPHYLRASTGSCHDICKYGRRHAFEEKARKLVKKRTVKLSLNKLNSTEIMVSGEQKTEKAVKHGPSADTKKYSHLAKPSPDAKSFLTKVKASFDAKTLSRRTASSSGKNCLPNSPTKEFTSLDTPEIVKREILLPKKVEVLLEGGNSIDNKMSRTDKKIYDQSLKHCSSVRSRPVKVKSSSASDSSDGIPGKGRRNSDVPTGIKMRVSMASANRTSVPAAAPLFPKCSFIKTASNKARKSEGIKLLSPPKEQNRMDRVENETSNSQVSEKTLHVIKTGTKKNAFVSVPDNHVIPALAPVSLSHANPSLLLHEAGDEEIKYSGNETDELASDNIVSMETGNVKPVKENDKTLGMGMGESALESIPDGHAIPALTSRSSPKSLSHPRPHEEDDEEITYSGDDVDEFVTDNIISVEIDKVQTVKEIYNKASRMETNNEFSFIPNGHVIPALPCPSSSKSSCCSKSSVLCHEENNEEIKQGSNEAHKLVRSDTISVDIRKAQPPMTVRKNRAVSSGEKCCRPVKVKFRSGKVLDLQKNNNIPRRLRFRRTRFSDNKADDSVSDNKKCVETDKSKSVQLGNVAPVKEDNKTSSKSRVRVSKDKCRSPVRLFTSGKLVGLQLDNNIPWRLRFRRARIPGVEDGKGDSKRTFIKAGSKDDAGGAELSSRKVNLKHQDLQGKKDAQYLFNNVIEETASKLVESRKSKVKALVGAFETVISLQERKPSSHTAN